MRRLIRGFAGRTYNIVENLMYHWALAAACSETQTSGFWFGLLFNVPVNSYGHIWTINSPIHTFSLDMLDLVVNQYFVHILSLVTDNPS